MWNLKVRKVNLEYIGILGNLETVLENMEWDVEIAKDYSLTFSENEVGEMIRDMLAIYSFNKEGFKDLNLLKNRCYKNSRVLFAHGGGIPWTFYEDKKPVMEIQKWVDENSKNYNVLFIQSCNPFKQMPIFRKVPIFYIEGIAGVPGEHKPKVSNKSNEYLAPIKNLINSVRSHSYCNGLEVFKL